MPEALVELPAAIQKKAAIVESGHEPQPPLLGMVPRRARALSVEERFQKFDEPVKDDHQVIDHLHAHCEAYRRFFTAMGKGIRSVVQTKAEQVRELDRKRQMLTDLAEGTGDQQLSSRTLELKDRLLRIVRMMGQATLLILRKIDLCQEGLQALAMDQGNSLAKTSVVPTGLLWLMRFEV
ncbi:MAG: hypothetical protein HYU36_25625 [Planctomycetes bacterium]|nr:hypothetical protein [Planctomycetota bacterium]